MARKKNNDYFTMLAEGVSYAGDAAAMLQECLGSYDPDRLPQDIEKMHAIEHEADIAKHEMLEKLLKEFITTIDREDILDLSDVIDDVTDNLEEVLLRLHMYNIRTLRSDANEFVSIIVKCCGEMKNMMDEFPNFRKSKKLKESIIEINRLEEEGDRLFVSAMNTLYRESNDPIEVMAWTSLYEQLEYCCDACEETANVVERVVLTNS